MKTYLDAGVLISAFRAEGEIGTRALQILDDENREFACSEFVKLEVLPKAIYHQRLEEVEFYETYFNAVQYWTDDIDRMMQDAYQIACQYGLAAIDALDVSAALALEVEELLTTERSTKPMHRITQIRITSIF